jgi:peroxiredoxin
MKQFGAIGFVVVMVALAAIYAWARLSSELGTREEPTVVISEEPTKHVVTPSMAEASRGMWLRKAPDFQAVGSDGISYSLRELIGQRPLLLTFSKIGCPCSEAAQPFFNRLAATYPRIRVLGVIDGDLGPAKLWSGKIHVSYPSLLDPDLKLVRAFGVENSAYVVLIDTKGQIAAHWPGYSASMIQQLGASLARLTNSPIRPIDTFDAPADLYSGCPFDL